MRCLLNFLIQFSNLRLILLRLTVALKTLFCNSVLHFSGLFGLQFISCMAYFGFQACYVVSCSRNFIRIISQRTVCLCLFCFFCDKLILRFFCFLLCLFKGSFLLVKKACFFFRELFVSCRFFVNGRLSFFFFFLCLFKLLEFFCLGAFCLRFSFFCFFKFLLRFCKLSLLLRYLLLFGGKLLLSALRYLLLFLCSFLRIVNVALRKRSYGACFVSLSCIVGASGSVLSLRSFSLRILCLSTLSISAVGVCIVCVWIVNSISAGKMSGWHK